MGLTIDAVFMVLKALDLAIPALTAQHTSGGGGRRSGRGGRAAAPHGQAGGVPQAHRPVRGAGQQQGIVEGVVPHLPHPVGMRQECLHRLRRLDVPAHTICQSQTTVSDSRRQPCKPLPVLALEPVSRICVLATLVWSTKRAGALPFNLELQVQACSNMAWGICPNSIKKVTARKTAVWRQGQADWHGPLVCSSKMMMSLLCLLKPGR